MIESRERYGQIRRSACFLHDDDNNRAIDGHIEYPPINDSSARYTFGLIESNGDKITGISTPEKKRT